MKECKHLNLYPDMSLQLKMARCGHFLVHGYWQCTDCDEWIFIECKDEWDGREGVKSKDGKYQYQRIKGKNKIVNLLENALHRIGEDVLPTGSYKDDVEFCEPILEEIGKLRTRINELEVELEQWKNKAIGYKYDLDNLKSEKAKLIEGQQAKLQAGSGGKAVD